ncbi:hypothetical protein MK852_19600 [Shewanella benthica]|uniref:hypothetical protein n=1 Tax=Shewanella TaxID=22 RepID=UPI0018792359|nr:MULTISPECIES: hypothetical protein [Shewanella]MBE7215314.1 hypothetical protein [Shewanella benthica]MBL4817489.1 hypothetical protein [Shewanella sp.]MCJ8302191.1 hypothetical protein [Shewanella sp.]MCL1064327.1 hypothetical protein [Shewanella benthica]
MISTTSERVSVDDPSLAHFLYALMSAFPIFFLPTLVGLFINLGQRTSCSGEMISSHLRWQRHSIIGFMLMGGIGLSLTQIWLSSIVYSIAIIWFCHRIVKGWLNLTDGAAV